MRSILVYADRGKTIQARLETALSLARMADGHVSVMVDTPIARYTSFDPLGGSYIGADTIREAMERDDAFADELAARLARDDVPYDVLRCEDEPVDALADAARLADVVVLSRDCDFAGDLALSTRCPILLVPNRNFKLGENADADSEADPAVTGTLLPIQRACIAWDGGEEAAAALRAAIPLLSGAEVFVLTVHEKQGGFPSTGALRYLSRHGIKAEFFEVERVGSTAESLGAAVARLQGDLLVMGAYGRSRMREFLFGGVTRHFLTAKVGPPLFLAH
ncbi:MAG: universal stress protein [Pseudomonadota bacterium]|nr:universal stress protein [Pseudomonadota bacterium]